MSISETENKRIASRARVLKTAKIYRLSGAFSIDVMVRDMSSTGARVVCKDQMMLPNELRFVLPTENSMRLAKVVWRRGELAGLHFTSEAQSAPSIKMQDSRTIQGQERRR